MLFRSIITTPSTVALDAANLERPVSVIGYDLNLPKYEPLPILHSLTDWLEFIQQIRYPETRINLSQKTSTFLDKSIVPGNAIERIIELIKFDIDIKSNKKNGHKNANRKGNIS